MVSHLTTIYKNFQSLTVEPWDRPNFVIKIRCDEAVCFNNSAIGNVDKFHDSE